MTRCFQHDMRYDEALVLICQPMEHSASFVCCILAAMIVSRGALLESIQHVLFGTLHSTASDSDRASGVPQKTMLSVHYTRLLPTFSEGVMVPSRDSGLSH